MLGTSETGDGRLGKVMSPNIDRLAAMGTTFLQTYNQNPGCAPIRTLTHTGRYSHRAGVYGFEYYTPVGQGHWRPFVPHLLRDQAGYQTVGVGKLGIRALDHTVGPKAKSIELYDTFLGYRESLPRKVSSTGTRPILGQAANPGRARKPSFSRRHAIALE